MITPDTSPQFFERLYQRQPDPWGFATTPYEQERFDALRSVLTDQRFEHAFEPACSTGELTARLATCCDRVQASDVSPTAVARARERCRGFSHVSIEVGALPHDLPAEPVDLLVLSECGYYFSADALAGLAATLSASLRPTATILAGHWLGSSPDHVLHGHAVHEILARTRGWQLDLDIVHADRCRITRWRVEAPALASSD